MTGKLCQEAKQGTGDRKDRPGSHFRFFAGEKNRMIGSPIEKPGLIDKRREPGRPQGSPLPYHADIARQIRIWYG